jgi:hypothetical protein
MFSREWVFCKPARSLRASCATAERARSELERQHSKPLAGRHLLRAFSLLTWLLCSFHPALLFRRLQPVREPSTRLKRKAHLCRISFLGSCSRFERNGVPVSGRQHKHSWSTL